MLTEPHRQKTRSNAVNMKISHFDISDSTNIFRTRASLTVACLLLKRSALLKLLFIRELGSGRDITYNLTTQ